MGDPMGHPPNETERVEVKMSRVQYNEWVKKLVPYPSDTPGEIVTFLLPKDTKARHIFYYEEEDKTDG